MREEYLAVLLRADGSRRTNPEDFQQWLLQAADEGRHVGPKARPRPLREAAEAEMDRRLALVSNADLHPESRQLIGAGWVQPNTN